MGIIKKNKKGVSLAELIASITIIGIASTTITTMVITSYRGQLRAQKYLLATEMAKTYDSMFARDITKANLQEMNDSVFVNQDDPNEKYVTVTAAMLQQLVKTEDGFAPIYNYLYSSNTNDHFQLNGTVFDSSNVELKIYMISKNFGYFKTKVIVTYNGDRQVAYDGTHFK